jgi:17beta-estradiol 17-dehydrogenase / very-long-chain 3-oxoacyl-CoA reductase
VLVSRTASKLDALAQNLVSTYKIKAHTLAMDFAANRDQDYAALATLIAPLEIGILVNNVGKSHDIPVPFAETSAEEMRDIININCTGTLRTTALVLPEMIARKRGLILTMGSFGGLIPTSLLATYSGSKAFLQQWSSALSEELYGTGITVELVQSYMVTSAMSKIKKPSTFVATPTKFVRSVLGSIGNTGGAQGFTGTSTPYWSHAVMQWALGTFLGFSTPFVVHQVKVMNESIRKRALRKAEREAKKQ